MDSSREGSWYITPENGTEDSFTHPENSSFAADYGLGMNMLRVGLTVKRYPIFFTKQLIVDEISWSQNTDKISMVYTHQWIFRRKQNTLNVDNLEEFAFQKKSRNLRLRDFSIAASTSTLKDINGRLLYEFYKAPRSDEYVYQFYQNAGHFAKSDQINWSDAIFKNHIFYTLDSIKKIGVNVDGFHLDSVSGMRRWAAADNYNTDHWTTATTPLTFSYNSGEVIQNVALSNNEHLSKVSDYLHENGYIVSANYNGSEARAGSWFGANKIDYFGVEQQLSAKSGKKNDRYVTPDSFAMYKRTIAYQRPISSLSVKNFLATLSHEEQIEALERSLFYGIWDGFSGVMPKVRRMMQDQSIRALYRTYTPILKRLANAGWEPVSFAHSSNKNIWVERFGALSEGETLFTLRNETDEIQEGKIVIDLSELEDAVNAPIQLYDLTNNKTLKMQRSNMTSSIEVTIKPKRTVVISLSR